MNAVITTMKNQWFHLIFFPICNRLQVAEDLGCDFKATIS